VSWKYLTFIFSQQFEEAITTGRNRWVHDLTATSRALKRTISSFN
jgi:hypothetical protein